MGACDCGKNWVEFECKECGAWTCHVCDSGKDNFHADSCSKSVENTAGATKELN